MKIDNKFIEYLLTKTIDPEGYPRVSTDRVVLAVDDIRRIIFHFQFQNREPYRDEETTQPSIGLLGE
jgi:hypothetical protein